MGLDREDGAKILQAGRLHVRPGEKYAHLTVQATFLLRAVTGHDLVHLVLQPQLLLLQALFLDLVF